MAEENGREALSDRRTVLRGLSAGAVLSYGGLQTVAAAADPHEEPTSVAPGTYAVDTSGVPDVKSAAVVVHDDGSITEDVTVDMDVSRARRDDDAVASTYSIAFADAPSGPAAASNRRSPATDLASLSPVIEKEDETPASNEFGAQSHRDGGISDPSELSTGSREYGVYGQTKSQECGPLARTILLSDFTEFGWGVGYYTNSITELESVSGAACEGHEWGDTFGIFCDLAEAFDADCDIPDMFNTSWNEHVSGATAGYGGSILSTTDFPVLPDRIVTAHFLELASGGSDVNFQHVVFATPDYPDVSVGIDELVSVDWTVNALTTLLGVDTTPYSALASNLLLSSESAVI